MCGVGLGCHRQTVWREKVAGCGLLHTTADWRSFHGVGARYELALVHPRAIVVYHKSIVIRCCVITFAVVIDLFNHSPRIAQIIGSITSTEPPT